jgi:hypothetical protein
MSQALLLPNLAATLIMVGIIWFVQIVHSPLMGSVGRDSFADYSQAHSRPTGYVVGPPTLVEARTAVFLVPFHPEEVSGSAAWVGVALPCCDMVLNCPASSSPTLTAIPRGISAVADRKNLWHMITKSGTYRL